MGNDRAEKYNRKRQEMIAAYRKKKLVSTFSILLAGVALLVLVAALKNVLNIAVSLVLSAMIIMITVIFARIRIVTVNHIMESQLRLLEQEEPEFHASFKK